VGINLSPVFQSAPDGTRYKEAKGWATLFVPAEFKFVGALLMLILVVAGALAGFVPALAAARVRPVVAMRDAHG